jgi:hypothetical protein
MHLVKPSVLRRIKPEHVARPFTCLYSSHANSEFASRPSIELDPSLRDLLEQSSDSLSGLKQKSHARSKDPVELHIIEPEIPVSGDVVSIEELEEIFERREERKSPAAAFGSRRLGHAVIPHELEHAVSNLIER